MRLLKSIIFIFLLIHLKVDAAEWKYRFSPILSLQYVDYLANINNTPSTHTILRAEGKIAYDYARNYKIRFNPLISYDASARIKEDRYFYDVPDGYISARFKPVTIQLGNKIYSWGVADGFNPVDIVNAHRLVSPLTSEKLGALSAYIKWDFMENFSLETVYIPIQRKTILPVENSRWLPRDVYISNSNDRQLILDEDFKYSYLQHEELNEALKNNIAMRLRGSVNSIDFSIIFFDGSSQSPATLLTVAGTGLSQTTFLATDIKIKKVYYRQRSIGGTIVYALDDIIFRYESAFHTPRYGFSPNNLGPLVVQEIPALPGSAEQHVLGIEKSFDIFGEEFTFILQGAYSEFAQSAENGTTSLARIFERAAILATRVAPTEELSITGSLLYDAKYYGELFYLLADYRLTDNLITEFSYSNISGQENSPLGTYTRNDLISLKIKYNF